MPAFDYLSPEQQAQAYYLYQKYEKDRRKSRRRKTAMTAIIGANMLGATMAVKKSDVMSDAEMRHRKKLQAKISTAGSIAGLTGLAGLGTAAAVRKYPNAFKSVPMVGRKVATKGHQATADSMKDKSYIAGAVSTGIGGIGGLNFAAIQRAESRKRNQPKPKS